MFKYTWTSKRNLAELNQRADKAEAELRAALEQVNGIKSGDLQSHNYIADTELLKSLDAMRQQMLRLRVEEQQRTWTNEGIAKFAYLIRIHQHDNTLFYDRLISNLVNYLQANQGQIYVRRKEESTYLELAGCYAFGKKKFMTNKLECGEGLVGQCFLEKEIIMMTQVPENYVRITSGLGEALPRCIILFPLLSENIPVGVIELASFRKFEEFEIQFVRKVAEGIASAAVSIGNSEKTNQLLRESQLQAEQLRAQEEEMRQNMEELSATQEEMKRVQMEMLAQTNIINNIAIVSRTDRQGNITYMNDEFCKWAKYSREELIGKNHRILKSGHQRDEIFKDMWQTINGGSIWRGEIKNRAKDGTFYWVDAIVAPVLGDDGMPKEYLAQLFVINDKKEREEQMIRNQRNLRKVKRQ
jgi:PAS domain S-box-containing protein